MTLLYTQLLVDTANFMLQHLVAILSVAAIVGFAHGFVSAYLEDRNAKKE